ncbi:phosphonate ABC transporter ATP-binding protein [Sporolactobacillus shoreicorticis]|uniref:Phosphonate ABC transporter ATP-binding protein n=1 Tax=Sporolactobacillus shoreicorticis TaxID=1923877 RepID=A0ABW5RYL7_9BACL|nr:phosphonate ABC transporter ATP-binding protein [Sporolactobacillus shoreicorticis]MCO7125061.1 phosphonate ABC transporter ATP-binding protein [Sporolactobacillus shoreicorticis]
MTDRAIIEFQNVSKTYSSGTQALKNISFRAQEGEAIILLGHNGSGKSTLLRTLTQFEPVTNGTVIFQETNMQMLNKKQLRALRRKIGFVFQNFHLVENLSVFQNVLFGALGRLPLIFPSFAPLAAQSERMKAMACLDRVGLSHLAARRAGQLSGGQQQKVAIARMLMQDPEIVLADEPVASLDPKAGIEIMQLLLEIVREKKLTMICTLHQLDLAINYAERLIALRDGEIIMDRRNKDLNSAQLNWIYENAKIQTAKRGAQA